MHKPEFTIAYTVFNKSFLLERIVEALRPLQEDIEILFLFDGCDDGSPEIFQKVRNRLQASCRAFMNPGYDLFEVGANNYLLQQAKGAYCLLVQDDMILPEPSDLLNLLSRIYQGDDRAGLVGFKDGYEMNVVDQYSNMLSAPDSDAKYADLRLKYGEFAMRSYVNRGPLCVPKKVYEGMGGFSMRYYPLFWDDTDYCHRVMLQGYQNYVAAAPVLSDPSWGATRFGSKLPCKQIYIANKHRFCRDHGFAVPETPRKEFARARLHHARMYLHGLIRGGARTPFLSRIHPL